MIRFRELPIGAVFRFTGEDDFPYSGMARGPWRKTAARKYVRLHDGMECRVGSINTGVIPEAPAPLRNSTLSLAKLVEPGAEGVNLDCDWPDNLRDFAADVENDKQSVADLIFPSKPQGYVAATVRLGDYANDKARAMEARLAGNVNEALRIEALCERKFQRIPHFAQW